MTFICGTCLVSRNHKLLTAEQNSENTVHTIFQCPKCKKISFIKEVYSDTPTTRYQRDYMKLTRRFSK